MKKSNYFSDFLKSYISELDDLSTDSGGNTVLKARLDEKRREIDYIVQMLEYSPEMVAVIFYGAFQFNLPKVMRSLVMIEADELDLPEWGHVAQALDVAEWAKPFVSKVLAQSAGDAFMTAVAALEFMRLHDGQEESHEPAVRPSDDSDKDDSENDEDGPEEDLDEAGQGWLQDQGFDTREG